MIPPAHPPPPSTPSRSEIHDDPPGVPGFPSWTAVYLAVVGLFVVVVALLSMLPILAR